MSFAASGEIVGVDQIRDWTVYKSKDGRPECGIISIPKESVNTKNGKVSNVIRGTIMLAVIVDPAIPRPNYLLSFQSGYPFKRASSVTMRVDQRTFTLEIGKNDDDNEWAWPPSNDHVIVDAMKKGSQAVLTAVSRRNTDTKDTFSLLGVTEALKVAEQQCPGNSS